MTKHEKPPRAPQFVHDALDRIFREKQYFMLAGASIKADGETLGEALASPNNDSRSRLVLAAQILEGGVERAGDCDCDACNALRAAHRYMCDNPFAARGTAH